MKHRLSIPLALLLSLFAILRSAKSDEFAAPLPDGVQAVWDMDKAFRVTRPRASESASTDSGAGNRPGLRSR